MFSGSALSGSSRLRVPPWFFVFSVVKSSFIETNTKRTQGPAMTDKECENITPPGHQNQTEKYFARGFSTTIALVDCSGCN